MGERVTWREELAIPFLLKNGLSYFNPASGSYSGRLLPMEAVLIEHSRVLLFVISDTTRGVSAMALVSTGVWGCWCVCRMYVLGNLIWCVG